MPERDLRYYEKIAIALSEKYKILPRLLLGLDAIPKYHRRAFYLYYQLIQEECKPNSKVLEVGSGYGTHSQVILNTGAQLTALDISEQSLNLLRTLLPSVQRTVVGNMETLPFSDSSFDVITCCAVLSYGNRNNIFKEFSRVLKPGGKLIILDTLGSNPVNFVLRLPHVLLGRRSFYMVLNMPKMSMVKHLGKHFKVLRTEYFDPLILLIPKSERSESLSLLHVKYSKLINRLNLKIENSHLKFLSFRIVTICQKANLELMKNLSQHQK